MESHRLSPTFPVSPTFPDFFVSRVAGPGRAPSQNGDSLNAFRPTGSRLVERGSADDNGVLQASRAFYGIQATISISTLVLESGNSTPTAEREGRWFVKNSA